MFYRIKTVKPLDGYRLLVCFENSETKEYDITPLFHKFEAFKPLAYITGLFEQVKVDTGGYGISWNDDIDLSCDELYFTGKIGGNK